MKLHGRDAAGCVDFAYRTIADIRNRGPTQFRPLNGFISTAVRWVVTPFFPRSGCMTGGADTGGIGVPLFPVDQATLIGL